MKKVLILQAGRDTKNPIIKDGSPAFVNGLIKSLERRGYTIDAISGNTIKYYTDSHKKLPIAKLMLEQSKNFAKGIKKEMFESYDLVFIIHPRTGLFLDKNNLPPIEKTVIFPMLLGKESGRFQYVSEEYIGLEKKLFENKYIIQSPSKVHANVLEEYYGVDRKNIAITPRGFSPLNFPPKERKLRNDISMEKPLRIFCANVIRPQKGYMHFIDLAKECKKNDFPIKVVIYGDSLNTDNKLYYEYAKSFLDQTLLPDICEYFEIHSSVDQKLLYSAMLDSDVAIIPSLYESFGKTVLECSGSGLPTIVPNDVLVYKEFLNDSNAIFYDRKPSALFNALKTLISDPTYYNSLSVNGIENGKKYFADDVYNSTIKDVLDLLKKRNIK